MNLLGLAYLGCRLLALFALVQGVSALVAAVTPLLLAEAPDSISFWPVLISPAVQISLGLLLWFAAGPIAARLTGRHQKASAYRQPVLVRAVLVSAALIILAMAAGDLAELSRLGWQQYQDARLLSDWPLLLPPAVAFLLRVGLAVALLLSVGVRALLETAEQEGPLLLLPASAERENASLIELASELAVSAGALGIRRVGDLAQRAVRGSLESLLSAVEQLQPEIRAAAAEDGQVTIVFSDMEGFTVMTQRLGDQQAHEVIKAHNAVVRTSVAEFQGQEVELQGDGFLLAFPDTAQALRCSMAIQQRLDHHNESHRHAPIRVRIGIHVGYPIREGDRFFGITLILAARIAAEAAGGEILVSSDARDLLSAEQEFRFESPLEAELKGLQGQHLMYPLQWMRIDQSETG